ncbi:hypothetical protein ACN38_g3977 [Penicillium nordicum]|uniref:Uncharacterized protein n=1 Tax=Penicillium nordicum TaxID=229535 RepID=A0A0M9WHI0_9EURO|nr:hypothetical protein ACN38_g3977 [Penicillium nordicum]
MQIQKVIWTSESTRITIITITMIRDGYFVDVTPGEAYKYVQSPALGVVPTTYNKPDDALAVVVMRQVHGPSEYGTPISQEISPHPF